MCACVCVRVSINLFWLGPDMVCVSIHFGLFFLSEKRACDSESNFIRGEMNALRLVRLRTSVKIPILKWLRKSFISSFPGRIICYSSCSSPPTSNSSISHRTAVSVSIVHQIGFISRNSSMEHISLMSLFFVCALATKWRNSFQLWWNVRLCETVCPVANRECVWKSCDERPEINLAMKE